MAHFTHPRAHIWRPVKNSADAKTLILLHGTGADEFDLLDLGSELDPRANLLSIRGNVIRDGMVRHFVFEPDGKTDEDHVIAQINKLAAFIAWASNEYSFDVSRAYAVGFSNGANAAGGLLLAFPELLAGVIAFGTTKTFRNRPFSPDLTGKRIWIANGARDSYSPPAATEAMVEEFTSLGASVKYFEHAGGHIIANAHVQEINRQLA